jgi:hypothetical protein
MALEVASVGLRGVDESRKLLDSIGGQFTAAALWASSVREFDSTFLGQIRNLASERAAEGADPKQVAAEIKTAVETRVQQALSEGVRNRGVAQWGVAQWIWNIVSLLVPIYVTLLLAKGNDELTIKYHQEVMHVLNQILQANLHSQTLAPAKPPADLENLNVVNVVLKVTALRTERSNKAAQIATVYPNQILHVIRISQRWAYVEYFDEVEGLPRTGWMYKKVLSKPRRQASRVQDGNQ